MHSQLCDNNNASLFDDEINHQLNSASKHCLADLSGSSLMDRVDSKFLLPTEQLLQVLNSCINYYSVLEIEDKSIFHYRNIYFDNNELKFYNQHHNRKLNRNKVRHRNYSDSDISYLEVKFKNNKGRTIKTRMSADNDPSIALDSGYAFLKQQGIAAPEHLRPSQLCTYNRISLANNQLSERITIDLNLSFTNQMGSKPRATEHNKAFKLSNYIIAELKQDKLNRHSPFFQLMRELAIRPQGFSKYCMGVSLSNKQVKSNRFKSNILKLHKGV